MAAKRVTRTGQFHVFLVDRPDRAGRRPEVRYVLVDPDDVRRRTRLVIAARRLQEAGGVAGLWNRVVTVTGSVSGAPDAPGGYQVMRVARIVVERTTIKRTRDAAVFARSTGATPWLTIMAKVKGVDRDFGLNEAYFDRIMSDTFPGMGHYWREVSYGRLNLAGSRAKGWLALPRTLDEYKELRGSGDDQRLLQEIKEDCVQAAINAGEDVTRFFGFNLMVNWGVWSGNFGFFEQVQAIGDLKHYGVTWLPPSAFGEFGHVNHHTIAHEMGHAYGMCHSGLDDHWEVMSDGCCGEGQPEVTVTAAPSGPEFRCVDVHPHAFNKTLPLRKLVPAIAPVNWLDGRLHTHTVPGTFRLGRLGDGASAHALAAVIPVAEGETEGFYIEVRGRHGYDKPLPDSGVVIFRAARTVQSDFRCGEMVRRDDGSVLWTAGQTCAIAGGPTIRVDAVDQTGATITVS